VAEVDEGGVYRSRTDTDDWDPDDEVGGAAHMLFDHGGTKAGLWRADATNDRRTVEVTIPARETILVLSGEVRVGVDGAPHELHTGDLLSIPPGALVGWDASPDCRVFWVYS
jgi:uncharacterized cupin superfamily protein